MNLSPRYREALMTAVPAVVTGTAAALQSAGDQDPLGSMALKTAMAGSAAALAGKYMTPMLGQRVKDIGSMAANSVRDLRGKGILSAAVGLPAAALTGAAAYQMGRAVNAPLNAMQVPGFQNPDPYVMDPNLAYTQALQDMAMRTYINYANPEAYQLSSNTQGALIGMY